MDKKTEAINLLNTYLSELKGIKEIGAAEAWKSKFLETVKIYVGSDSNFYTESVNETFTTNYDYDFSKETKNYFISLVGEVIKHITAHGVLEKAQPVPATTVITQPIKNNWFSEWEHWKIIVGMGTIAVVAFGLGFTFQYYLGTAKMERLEYESLKEKDALTNTIKEKEVLNENLNKLNSVYETAIRDYKTKDSLSHIQHTIMTNKKN